jgi:hypothetical protein
MEHKGHVFRDPSNYEHADEYNPDTHHFVLWTLYLGLSHKGTIWQTTKSPPKPAWLSLGVGHSLKHPDPTALQFLNIFVCCDSSLFSE